MKTQKPVLPVLLLLILAAAQSGCDSANGNISGDSAPITDPHNPSLRMVTDEFGPAVVTAGEFQAGDTTHQSAWTSWYFPANNSFLAKRSDGQQSPLQKYDAYVKKAKGVASSAADTFYNKRFDPANSDAGDGLCNAWSAAALMEPEPKHARCAGGVRFDIIDLKALLVLSYETLQKKFYGQPFTDPYKNDIMDIYPEQLHRLLQVTLYQDGTPIVIDKDDNTEIWNTPVTAADIQVVADSQDPHVVHVSTSLLQTAPLLSDADLTPTEVKAGQTLLGYIGQKAFWQTYTYDLVGDPTPEGLKVVYGTWTGDSAPFHPDFAAVLPKSKDTRGSIDNIVDPKIVDEIVYNNSSDCP